MNKGPWLRALSNHQNKNNKSYQQIRPFVEVMYSVISGGLLYRILNGGCFHVGRMVMETVLSILVMSVAKHLTHNLGVHVDTFWKLPVSIFTRRQIDLIYHVGQPILLTFYCLIRNIFLWWNRLRIWQSIQFYCTVLFVFWLISPLHYIVQTIQLQDSCILLRNFT